MPRSGSSPVFTSTSTARSVSRRATSRASAPGGAQPALDAQHQPLQLGERRVAHAARRIVRERAAMHVHELGGAGTDQAVDPDVLLHIQGVQALAQQPAAPLDRELLDGNPHAPPLARGAPREEDLEGREHLAAAERGTRGSAPQEHLVHVVVEDLAETLEGEATERAAELLREGVTQRVGVAEPLALDDLDPARSGARALERAHAQIHRSLQRDSRRVPGSPGPRRCSFRANPTLRLGGLYASPTTGPAESLWHVRCTTQGRGSSSRGGLRGGAPNHEVKRRSWRSTGTTSAPRCGTRSAPRSRSACAPSRPGAT